MRLKVSIPTDDATSINIARKLHFDNLTGLAPLGSVVGIERDSDEFTIITIELTDDDAELIA